MQKFPYKVHRSPSVSVALWDCIELVKADVSSPESALRLRVTTLHIQRSEMEETISSVTCAAYIFCHLVYHHECVVATRSVHSQWDSPGVIVSHSSGRHTASSSVLRASHCGI